MWFWLLLLQGDVTGILDGSGNIVVNYSYDAWAYALCPEALRQP